MTVAISFTRSVGNDDYAYEQKRNWKAKTHEEERI